MDYSEESIHFGAVSARNCEGGHMSLCTNGSFDAHKYERVIGQNSEKMTAIQRFSLGVGNPGRYTIFGFLDLYLKALDFWE